MIVSVVTLQPYNMDDLVQSKSKPIVLESSPSSYFNEKFKSAFGLATSAYGNYDNIEPLEYDFARYRDLLSDLISGKQTMNVCAATLVLTVVNKVMNEVN